MEKKVPLSLESFKKYIAIVRRDEEVCDGIYDASKQTIDLYETFESPGAVVNLLGLMMHDSNDWIGYWLYELNYGKDWKPGCITDENDNDIKIETEEDLYNFLVSEY